MRERNRKKHDMKIKSTQRLQKIRDTENKRYRRQRKVKNKANKAWLESLKKLAGGVLGCTGRGPGLERIPLQGSILSLTLFRTAGL